MVARVRVALPVCGTKSTPKILAAFAWVFHDRARPRRGPSVNL